MARRPSETCSRGLSVFLVLAVLMGVCLSIQFAELRFLNWGFSAMHLVGAASANWTSQLISLSTEDVSVLSDDPAQGIEPQVREDTDPNSNIEAPDQLAQWTAADMNLTDWESDTDEQSSGSSVQQQTVAASSSKVQGLVPGERKGEPTRKDETKSEKAGELERLFDGMRLKAPHERLEKYLERMRNHKVWVDYRSVHHNILTGQAPKRYLVYRTVSGQGFGNLFAGVELAFYLAVASDRAILVDWGHLERVFEPRDVDWRMSKRRADLITTKSREISFLNMVKPELKPRQILRLARTDLQVLYVKSNAGVQGWEEVLKFDEQGKWNTTLKEWVRPWFRLRGFVFHALFKLPPSGEFADMWSQANSLIPPGPRIGVHIRVGDVSWSSGNSDRRPIIYDKQWGLKKLDVAANQSLHCAQELARQLQFQAPCAIVFESDNEDTKKFARKAGQISGGPCIAWASPMESKHSAMSGGSEMQTWLSLVTMSTVEILLVTQGTFGYTAGMVGPGMAGFQRMPKFEDFLIKRAKLKLPRDEMHNMCHLSRQPQNRKTRLDLFLGMSPRART